MLTSSRNSVAHATRRRQFGRTLGEFQLVQEKLARMATDLTAARLLTYRAAWEKDRGAERVTLEAAMAKAFATEAAQRIVDDAVQILGGRGVLRSEEHTSELQSHSDLVCRLLLEKKNRARRKTA